MTARLAKYYQWSQFTGTAALRAVGFAGRHLFL